MPAPLIVINTVALPVRHLALAPRLSALAAKGWSRPMQEVYPAVTCTAQATMLTGELPENHGIVGNGWLFRDTMEVRFWQQSNRLVQAEPVYTTARRRAEKQGRPFRCAKLFWWFNQGADVDLSVTPKPHYGSDGDKRFDIQTSPPELADNLKKRLGSFPFPTFWGPMAGLGCTKWIAQCAAEVLKTTEGGPPDLTFVYLPHLDYDTQRFGPSGCDWKRLVGELDAACAPLLDAAAAVGARVWLVNEYTHLDVDTPIYINRILAKAGLLQSRPGPFGDQLDTFGSTAFAVCDHQLAHIYVRTADDVQRVRDIVEAMPGVGRVFSGLQRMELGLNHPRAGDLVALSKPNAWFAYPFWLDDARAPDYARTVDIHRKPGYDPCELVFDPAIRFPKLRAARRLAAKKMGFRTRFDLTPLDASLVKGSHGLRVASPQNAPVFIADGPQPPQGEIGQPFLRNLVLSALGLEHA
ncbi:MAG: alkaline phosphatase family protein [Gemmataceae bacterium]